MHLEWCSHDWNPPPDWARQVSTARLERGSGVNMLELSDRRCWLKIYPDRPGRWLRRLGSGRGRHSLVWNEAVHSLDIGAAGLAVAPVLSWGEWRSAGIPRAGYLLTEHVPGASLQQLALDNQLTEDMLLGYAALFGELHRRGLGTPIRFKDLILTDSGLTLIDREPRAGLTPSIRARARRSLVRGLRRNRRSGVTLSPEQLQLLIAACVEHLSLSTADSSVLLVQIRRELGNLGFAFPDEPGCNGVG